MSCDLQTAGTIELYFYGELDAAERAVVRDHLPTCAECRQTLDEMRTIRDALASRPDVSGPPDDDWSGFMSRLDAAVRPERVPGVVPFERRTTPAPVAYAGYLAMAALLALVTMSVVYLAKSRASFTGAIDRESAAVSPLHPARVIDPSLAAVGQEHIERSKLVILGLTAKDAQEAVDWEYERELAQSLLNDTRLYRITAEERGMSDLAGVLRDLEMVLLQTALTEQTDSDALAQIQRLIRKRDLVGKMDFVKTAGS